MTLDAVQAAGSGAVPPQHGPRTPRVWKTSGCLRAELLASGHSLRGSATL